MAADEAGAGEGLDEIEGIDAIVAEGVEVCAESDRLAEEVDVFV